MRACSVLSAIAAATAVFLLVGAGAVALGQSYVECVNNGPTTCVTESDGTTCTSGTAGKQCNTGDTSCICQTHLKKGCICLKPA